MHVHKRTIHISTAEFQQMLPARLIKQLLGNEPPPTLTWKDTLLRARNALGGNLYTNTVFRIHWFGYTSPQIPLFLHWEW